MQYRRRLANFKIFRKNLRIPLVAVEVAHGPQFELRPGDAEILIQLRDGAVLWQKERLLNIALQALPSECDKVAWLDCDIIFKELDWAEAANDLLDRFPSIQLFQHVHYLGHDWSPQAGYGRPELTRPSAAFSLVSGVPAATCIGHSLDVREGTPAPGFAWAASRQILDRHGFFDTCIVGGGNKAMVCAAQHCFAELMFRHCMNDHQRQYYLTWAEPYYETVRGEIAFLDAEICHLWHGDQRDRKPRARHEGLAIDNGGSKSERKRRVACKHGRSPVHTVPAPAYHASVCLLLPRSAGLL